MHKNTPLRAKSPKATLVQLHEDAGNTLMGVYEAGKAWITHPHGGMALYASGRAYQCNDGARPLTESNFDARDEDTKNLSAHAQLEGEAKKSEVDSAWRRHLLAVGRLEKAVMTVLGRVSPGWKLCVDTTVRMSFHNSYGQKGMTLHELKMGFGFSRVGKPETGGALCSPKGLFPQGGCYLERWNLESQRLLLLESLGNPDIGQAPWHVFVPGDTRSEANTFLRSRPHYARDAQEALLRCAVLEWPDLLGATAPNTITVAQAYVGGPPAACALV